MKELLDITKIGTLTLKNCFIKSSIGDHSISGHLNKNSVESYVNLAKGGVGTIITGYTLVISDTISKYSRIPSGKNNDRTSAMLGDFFLFIVQR